MTLDESLFHTRFILALHATTARRAGLDELTHPIL